MRLLVTRPEPDARRTAAALAARGHEPVVAPLTEIRPTGAAIPATPVQALLLTSANAARVLADRPDLRRLTDATVFAVGAATADAARAAGFGAVHDAAGDAEALAALVRGALEPGDGPLLHLAGRHLAADLGALLGGEGFVVHHVAVYEAVAAPALPAPARAALAAGSLDGALVHSPRSARLLSRLAAEAGLAERLARLHVYCLSPAVAAPFAAAGQSEVTIAATPDEAALLAALPDAAVATAKPNRV